MAGTSSPAAPKETKPTATRIYVLTSRKADDIQYLVEASSPSQALRILADQQLSVAVANGKQIAGLMSKGAQVLTADGFAS